MNEMAKVKKNEEDKEKKQKNKNYNSTQHCNNMEQCKM